MPALSLKNQVPGIYWGIYLVLIFIVCAIAFLALRNARQALIVAAEKNLQAIGQYKSDEIRNWLKERTGDASVLKESPHLPEELNHFLDKPEDFRLKAAINDHFNPFYLEYGYQDIMLVDASGRIYFSINESKNLLGCQSQAVVQKSFRKKNYYFSDFYYCDRHKGIHIDFYVPVYRFKGDPSGPRAMILLRVDPKRFLYPLLQSWPSISKSSETLLIRKQNDSVIYLNDLRHRKGTALKLKFPITDPDLPAAMAARGIEGIITGKDYRDVPVIAFIRHIEGAPWSMVNKTDLAEVLQPMKFWTISTIIISTFLILIIGFILILIMNQRKKDHFKSLYELELQKEVLTKHYDYLLKYANDIILLVGRDHRIIDCNEKAVLTYGYSREELNGMKIDHLVTPGFSKVLEDRIQEIEMKQGLIFESSQRKKDGSIFPVEISARTITIDNSIFIQSIIRDITDRKKIEQELLKTNQYLENLLNYANAPIIVWNPQFRITRFNHAFESITGRMEDEVIGQSLEILFPPELIDHSMSLIRKTISGERWETVEIKILNVSGDVRTVLWNSATLFGVDGKTPISTIAQGNDITERKMVENGIAESENRFRGIFENAPIGIGLARKGKMLYTNKTYARMFGFSSPDELIGTNISDVIHPDVRNEIIERNKNRENNYSVTDAYETRGIRKDGSSFPFFTNVTIIQLNDGPATMGFFQDLTAQKNAQSAVVKSEKRYRMLFSSMVEGFALHDLVCNEAGEAVDYRFLDINPAFERLTGLKANEIVGRNVTEVLPGLEKEWIDRYAHVALTGEPITFEQFNTSLGRHYRIMAFSPARNQFAVLFEDVTESRKIQEEIRQLNLELEQRVADRTAELEVANKEMESFSYSVSHDLRAPLRSLDGFSQAILEDYAALLNEQGKNYLNRIRTASQKMAHLIDDLLRLSRISRQTMKSETVDLSVMAGSLCNDLLSDYPDIVYQVNITPGIMVKADSALIRIAMGNLLSNAFKFSARTAKPCIYVGMTEPGQNLAAEIFICDNGAGFDMKYAGKLFGAFQRLHTLEEFPGTGIGLTIVQRIIQRHKGSIRAESVPGEKTCFYFTLPDVDKRA